MTSMTAIEGSIPVKRPESQIKPLSSKYRLYNVIDHFHSSFLLQLNVVKHRQTPSTCPLSASIFATAQSSACAAVQLNRNLSADQLTTDIASIGISSCLCLYFSLSTALRLPLLIRLQQSPLPALVIITTPSLPLKAT